jgi:hypothetical protein
MMMMMMMKKMSWIDMSSYRAQLRLVYIELSKRLLINFPKRSLKNPFAYNFPSCRSVKLILTPEISASRGTAAAGVNTF